MALEEMTTTVFFLPFLWQLADHILGIHGSRQCNLAHGNGDLIFGVGGFLRADGAALLVGHTDQVLDGGGVVNGGLDDFGAGQGLDGVQGLHNGNGARFAHGVHFDHGNFSFVFTSGA